MRVRIEIEDGREEVDIIVKCGGKSAYIDRLAAAMYMVDR